MFELAVMLSGVLKLIHFCVVLKTVLGNVVLTDTLLTRIWLLKVHWLTSSGKEILTVEFLGQGTSFL
jgi:hypothetical protein